MPRQMRAIIPFLRTCNSAAAYSNLKALTAPVHPVSRAKKTPERSHYSGVLGSWYRGSSIGNSVSRKNSGREAGQRFGNARQFGFEWREFLVLIVGGVTAHIFDRHFQSTKLDHQIMTKEQRIY